MSLVNTHKIGKLCLNKHPILFTAIRTHFNKDYKPTPFPKTPEERLASAKKYGILPHEYEPFPDNGTGLGDYPNIPMASGDSKDPFYPYDNPELKRNFGEVMNADFDLMGEDRYDVNFRHRIPLLTQVFQFCAVMFGTFGVYCILENCKMFPALLPKQYPHQDKKHYTFESSE